MKAWKPLHTHLVEYPESDTASVAKSRFCFSIVPGKLSQRYFLMEVDQWILLSLPERIFWQESRLPQVYFPASNFVKDPLKEWKHFFRKILFLHVPSTDFSKFGIFFRRKTSQLRWKKFSKNNTISYAFYSKFVTFNDFEKVQIFFSKKTTFSKITKFWRFWEISVAFYGKFATYWW